MSGKRIDGKFADNWHALMVVVNLMDNKISFGVQQSQTGPIIILQGNFSEVDERKLETVLKTCGAASVFSTEL